MPNILLVVFIAFLHNNFYCLDEVPKMLCFSWASGMSKMMEERLYNLKQYSESTTSKKQQRGDLLMNERSGGPTLKIGNQIHRSPSDIISQKMEDRPKNVILNRRVRTSLADTRVCS